MNICQQGCKPCFVGLHVRNSLNIHFCFPFYSLSLLLKKLSLREQPASPSASQISAFVVAGAPSTKIWCELPAAVIQLYSTYPSVHDAISDNAIHSLGSLCTRFRQDVSVRAHEAGQRECTHVEQLLAARQGQNRLYDWDADMT